MKAEIKSIVCNWADEIPHILIRVINAITLSANEEELRAAVKRIAEETEFESSLHTAMAHTIFGLPTAGYPMESQRNTDY